MEFYYLHLMSWPALPRDFERRARTAWVLLSNRCYDPRRGHRLYNEYLDELEAAAGLGFDGLALNEHHQTAYGTVPAPNVMAAALARRTEGVRLALLGNAIALREQPLRVAEEVALLDVLSGGRIVSGFVRGIGCEYFSLGVNPVESRARFREAHDLILRAWTTPGPFGFEGRYYQARYVNLWPRPLQRPHPPVWIPSQGSPETIRFAAERRYPFLVVFCPTERAARLFEAYRAAAAEGGHRARPEQLGLAVPTYVAPTDGEAHADARRYFLWLFRKALRIPMELLLPPGYVTDEAFYEIVRAGLRPPADLAYEELEREGYILVGSPRTVRDRLAALHRRLGFGLFVMPGRIGPMPQAVALRSAELFAREVIPAFRRPRDRRAPQARRAAGAERAR